MGKLLEALKKQLEPLDELRRTPRPDHIAKPEEAFAHLEKEKRLNYKLALLSRGLNDAFARLKPEQRAAFYRQSAAPEKRARMAMSEFERVTMQMGSLPKQERDQAKRAFILNDDSFGRPWRELIPIMEEVLRDNHGEDVLSSLPANLSQEERAFRLYDSMNLLQRRDLYEKATTPQRKQRYESEYIESQIALDKLGGSLLRDDFYGAGRSWQQGIEQLETLLEPQTLEQITAQFENVPDPENSAKLVSPEEKQLNKLRGEAAGDPRKLKLLDQAADILRYPKNDYLRYLDSKSTNADTMAGDHQKHSLQKYLDEYEHGILKGKMRDTKGRDDKLPEYNPADVTPKYRNENAMQGTGVDLTDQELDALRQGAELPLDAGAKDAMLAIAKGFDAIGEKKYWIPEAVNVLEGSAENPIQVYYKSEQGNKKYAFWPLVNAKEALRKAVQNGDWAGIETNLAEYQRIKTITDEMMQTARNANALPIFPANVNSTRVDQDNKLNPMPTEYLEDYTAHCRVNGTYVLYTVSKNLGVELKDLLDKPGQVFQQQANQFIQSRMMDSFRQESAGARLAKSLNGPLQLAAEQEWSINLTAFNRGGDALSSLCVKEADRIKAVGRNFSALASANYTVGLETRPWRAMAFANPERKTLIARMAMLLPENQLDLKDLGNKLERSDWEKTINPSAEIKRLRKANQLDYAALTARSRNMIRDAAEAEKHLQEGQSVSFYQSAALQNYRLLMRSASEDERKTEGFKAMAAHAVELQTQLAQQTIRHSGETFKSWRQSYNRNLDTLARDKSGWFLSSKNSPEYERMMKGLKDFNAKLDLLQGREPLGCSQEEKERLLQADPAELYQKAWRGCMDYSCEKTNYGNDNILHTAGRVRNRTALSCAEMLGNLADSFGLRSPAMRLKENTELEVLRKRGSTRWESRNGERSAAKALCGIYLEQQGVSWEKQKRLLSDEKLASTLENVRRTAQFRRMVHNLQDSGLCGKVVRGASALSEAYNQAGQQLRQEQQRRELRAQVQREAHEARPQPH